jgi:hypothetical protein
MPGKEGKHPLSHFREDNYGHGVNPGGLSFTWYRRSATRRQGGQGVPAQGERDTLAEGGAGVAPLAPREGINPAPQGGARGHSPAPLTPVGPTQSLNHGK